jgi:hypothetical protein
LGESLLTKRFGFHIEKEKNCFLTLNANQFLALLVKKKVLREISLNDLRRLLVKKEENGTWIPQNSE